MVLTGQSGLYPTLCAFPSSSTPRSRLGPNEPFAIASYWNVSRYNGFVMSIVEGIDSHFIARSRPASKQDALSFPNTMLCMLSLERLNQTPSIPPNACFPPFLAHE